MKKKYNRLNYLFIFLVCGGAISAILSVLDSGLQSIAMLFFGLMGILMMLFVYHTVLKTIFNWLER